MRDLFLAQPNLEPMAAKLHRELQGEILPFGIRPVRLTIHAFQRREDGILVWAYW
jgi:hypothetical protein